MLLFALEFLKYSFNFLSFKTFFIRKLGHDDGKLKNVFKGGLQTPLFIF